MMYEGVLLFGVVFIAGYLFDTLTQSRNALALRHVRQFVLFVAIGLYFILSWRRGGQTLPMKTWNIRLVDRGSQAMSVSRLTLRYILLWPLPLLTALLVYGISQATGYPSIDLFIVCAPFSVFIWTWLDPQGQFLHDRVLGTRLVDLKAPPSIPTL
jgi:uncharacterized RDD family membrane protein YckC